MEEWRGLVEDKLRSFDFPIDIADLCRLVGLSVDRMGEMFEEIARISDALVGTSYALVVEEGKCTKCYRSVRFKRKYDFKCDRCGGFATLPKVCINPR